MELICVQRSRRVYMYASAWYFRNLSASLVKHMDWKMLTHNFGFTGLALVKGKVVLWKIPEGLQRTPHEAREKRWEVSTQSS